MKYYFVIFILIFFLCAGLNVRLVVAVQSDCHPIKKTAAPSSCCWCCWCCSLGSCHDHSISLDKMYLVPVIVAPRWGKVGDSCRNGSARCQVRWVELTRVELSCLPACCLSDVVSTSSATIITTAATTTLIVFLGKGKPLQSWKSQQPSYLLHDYVVIAAVNKTPPFYSLQPKAFYAYIFLMNMHTLEKMLTTKIH